MIGRPSWEKDLRRRLRSKAKKVSSKHRMDSNGMIASVFIGASMIAVFSLAAEDDTTRMVAVALVTGIYGTLLGGVLRARWEDGVWLAPFAPVNARVMRNLETRGALPDLIRVFLIGLAMASLGSLAGWPHAPLKALPVAGSSMVIGVLFAGGCWGKYMLWASGIGATAWALAGQLETGTLSYRYLHGWIPAFPLSLWTGNSSLLVPRLIVFAVALLVVFFEWRKAWQRPDPEFPSVERSDDDQDEVSDHETTFDPLPEPADPRPGLRDEVRATVTRGWIGLVAYVHANHIAWMDRWLWKSLVPRQRMLACLGMNGTWLWLRKVKLACALLAVSVALFWMMRLSMERHLGSAMAEYGILLGLPALGFALFAFAASFPSAKSIFEPWTSPFKPGLQRYISALAIFPITPAEWARCASREWQLRACLVASIWSIATVATALAFVENAAPRDFCGWILSPWFLFAAMLPFSVGGRLLRAHYGKTQGFILGARLLFSLGMMVISPAAVVVGIIGIALQHFPVFAGGMAVAFITGSVGLRMAVASCGNMRNDITFDAEGEP